MTWTKPPAPWRIEQCMGRGPHWHRWKVLDADGKLITIIQKAELAAFIADAVNAAMNCPTQGRLDE